MTLIQKCPVCDGTGLVSRPPYIAGDQESWHSGTAGPYPCKTCCGTGVVAIVTPIYKLPENPMEEV
jgi:RecJ-like exonuclease